MFKYFSYLLVLTAFVGCTNFSPVGSKSKGITPDFKTVRVKNEYRIDLPKFMRKAKDLHDEAALQYQNIFKETYLIAMDVSKEDIVASYTLLGVYDTTLTILENYRKVNMSFIKENIDISYSTHPLPIQINKLNAERIQVDALVEGVPQEIAYFFQFVEGYDKLYMIMAWTLKKRKSKYKKLFKKSFRSFRMVEEKETTDSEIKDATL